MSQTAWFLVPLLCYVLQSVISGNDDKPTNSGLSKNAEFFQEGEVKVFNMADR